MQITVIRKWQPVEYESESMALTIGHEELGLPAPTSVQEAYALAQQMQYHAKALSLIIEVKANLIHPNQISERLKNWIPNGMSADLKNVD